MFESLIYLAPLVPDEDELELLMPCPDIVVEELFNLSTKETARQTNDLESSIAAIVNEFNISENIVNSSKHSIVKYIVDMVRNLRALNKMGDRDEWLKLVFWCGNDLSTEYIELTPLDLVLRS